MSSSTIDPAPDAGAASASVASRWRAAVLAPGVVRPLAVYAASRAVVLLAFLLAATIASVLGDDLRAGRPWPPAPAGQSLTLTALTGWDGTWYAEIARHGYGPRSSMMAFFPGFPLAVKALAGITGWSHATAAVAAGTLFGALAAVLLWQLSERLGGRQFADRSTTLFAFFPGSFVFSMGYAEPLMLAAVLGSLLAVERRQWVLAGACGAVATATRPNALVLVAALVWGAVAANRRGEGWKPLCAPLLSLAGVAAYFAFLWRRTGSAFAWFDIERNLWNETFSPAHAASRVDKAFQQLAGNRPGPDLNYLLPAVGLVFAVVALVLLARWRPPGTLTLYAAGVVVLAAGSSNLGLRPRFLVTAFPLLQAVAWKVRGSAFAVIVAVSAVVLGALVAITVLTLLATP